MSERNFLNVLYSAVVSYFAAGVALVVALVACSQFACIPANMRRWFTVGPAS